MDRGPSHAAGVLIGVILAFMVAIRSTCVGQLWFIHNMRAIMESLPYEQSPGYRIQA